MEFIYEIKNHIPDEYCDRIIERYSFDGRKAPGQTIGGVNEKWKRSTDLTVSIFDDWDDTTEFLVEKVKEGIDKFHQYCVESGFNKMQLMNAVVDNRIINKPQIQHTKEGGFYRWHHDSLFGGVTRVFTYIFYLNDVPPEDGGYTEFLMGKKVQPEKGKLLLFPSTWTYIHRGKKLEKGNKYIATGFVYGE
jgi:hypothetical protein